MKKRILGEPSFRLTAMLHYIVQFCACFLCAAFATLIAHQLIDCFTELSGLADAYDAYKHIALGPLLLFACILAVALIGRFAVLALARSGTQDVLEVTTRATLAIAPPLLVAITVCGATLLLFGVESYEQFSALGHIEGLNDALGGNIAIGLSILMGVSAVVACLASTAAHVVARTIALSCRIVIGLFLSRDAGLSLAQLQRMKAALAIIVPHDEPLPASGLGLRAPPHSL